MKQIVTTAIVLKRINFGEADRIITCITPDHGKVRLMAKGVRKNTSKLAGGIELFSVSNITFIPGKKDIGTLVSSRLQKYFDLIVKDIDRTMLAYELLKTIDKTTQDECEPTFFELLAGSLEALNNTTITTTLIDAWFVMQLLQLSGHGPNLVTDTEGRKLQVRERYSFDFEHMAFAPNSRGTLSDQHIKVLRLLGGQTPLKMANIQNIGAVLAPLQSLLKTLAKQHA